MASRGDSPRFAILRSWAVLRPLKFLSDSTEEGNMDYATDDFRRSYGPHAIPCERCGERLAETEELGQDLCGACAAAPICDCGESAETPEHGRDLCRACAEEWAREEAAEAKADAQREDRE